MRYEPAAGVGRRTHSGPVADHGYGLVTFVKVPGDFAVPLYQPKYAKG
ncbi:hypothetical protein [Urbifossiella limnaea]|uniref:Uncharacterized protein n=1 Tax=Urbifossiella limnaea TaxID=2528023 RepID=A0A517Y2U2_9BACT|nr:hypothetical protein [Urbifossiella limnaea]QDU24116.1 hypothetical protein ETAA1_61290 [Urbifossiella limnaea]